MPPPRRASHAEALAGWAPSGSPLAARLIARAWGRRPPGSCAFEQCRRVTRAETKRWLVGAVPKARAPWHKTRAPARACSAPHRCCCRLRQPTSMCDFGMYDLFGRRRLLAQSCGRPSPTATASPQRPQTVSPAEAFFPCHGHRVGLASGQSPVLLLIAGLSGLCLCASCARRVGRRGRSASGTRLLVPSPRAKNVCRCRFLWDASWRAATRVAERSNVGHTVETHRGQRLRPRYR